MREFLEREYGHPFQSFGGKGREYYAAVKGLCVVFLVEREAGDISYKIIGEGSHPYYYNVPAKVWAKLTTLPDDPIWNSAREWRAKVQSFKVSYEPGTRLKLSGQVHWETLGIHTDELVVVDWKKKHFRANGTLVRCTSVMYYSPTVLS
jgi:hypothetical protein